MLVVLQYGNTPLIKTCEHGHRETIELLIAKGADIEAQKQVRHLVVVICGGMLVVDGFVVWLLRWLLYQPIL
jgi:ankyrin repeat protein